MAPDSAISRKSPVPSTKDRHLGRNPADAAGIAVVGSPAACRPAAGAAGAQPGGNGCPGLLRQRGFRVRGRARPAALAGQRDAPACLRHRHDRRGRDERPALSPYLARILDEKAAGGRRGADRVAGPCVAQSRAERAAPSGIHDARMVPRRRAGRGDRARLPQPSRHRRRPRGVGAAALPRAGMRPGGGSRAAERCGRLCAPRGDRSVRDDGCERRDRC